jgi:uncharacterized protein DUF3300
MESQAHLRLTRFASSSCLTKYPIDPMIGQIDQTDQIVWPIQPGLLRNSSGKCGRSGSLKRRPQRYIAPVLLLVLFSSGQGTLFAQQPMPPVQGWPQNDPYGAQYSPDQQPEYGQPQYPQPQPYGQQPPVYAPPPQYGQSPSYPPQSYPGTSGQYQQPAYGEGQPPAQALNTEQLEQLVAPIALYPDTLVAQVLAAATYPAQVVDADHWRQAQGYASPDQIAAGADSQNWDPSLKALTAFPQVLGEMDQNLRWTIALGNAYYNQPQDVLDVVQVMRQRAEVAGNLQGTPQEGVNYDQGYIQLAPVNPQVVYVPAYDPWTVYGQPIQPYRGFSLGGALGSFFGSSIGSGAIRYGLGIAMSAFSHTSFGWLGWGLDWLTHSLLFHNSTYYSHGNTVADWGLPHGGPRAAFNRGAMSARSSNNLYRPQNPVNSGRPGESPHGYGGWSSNNRPNGLSYARPADRYGERLPTQGNYRGNPSQGAGNARPPMMAYNRVEPPANRIQNYDRPNSGFGYGSGFRSAPGGGYGTRPNPVYNPPQQAYRAPASDFQRGKFSDRSSGGFGGRGFDGYSGKQPKSSGFHAFGGGHEPKYSSGGGRLSHGHSEKGGHSGGIFGGHRR